MNNICFSISSPADSQSTHQHFDHSQLLRFWFLGYVTMFFVFLRRLKEIGALSRVHRNVFGLLLYVLVFIFVSYMVIMTVFVFEVRGYDHVHTVKSLLLVLGIISYLYFAVMIMVLFSRKLW